VPSILVGAALRGLQGIHLFAFRPCSSLNVRGHVAGPETPFSTGFRKAYAVSTGRKFLDFLAAFTLIIDLVTITSVKLTSVRVHKETLYTFLYACTNHGYHILSALFGIKIIHTHRVWI